jgi:hypothetical protein
MLPHQKIFYLKPLSTYKTSNVIVYSKVLNVISYDFFTKKKCIIFQKNKSMRISKYFTVSKSDLKIQQNEKFFSV